MISLLDCCRLAPSVARGGCTMHFVEFHSRKHMLSARRLEILSRKKSAVFARNAICESLQTRRPSPPAAAPWRIPGSARDTRVPDHLPATW